MMRGDWSRRRFLAGLLGLPSAVGACGNRSVSYQSPGDLKIVLAENPWLGSAINTAIARYLLEDQMGVEVEVRQVSESEQWELLANGDVHASLEIWPLRNVTQMAKYAATGLVEDGGQLGPVAKSGWYIPSYVLSDRPELESWEALKDPATTAVFRTSQSGSKGQILTGDRAWATEDEAIVRNLGLELNVVYAGGEEQLLAQIETAYAKRAAILFYLWFPHWLHGVRDFTSIELPRYTNECGTKKGAGSYNCDYPSERLLKMFWPNLLAVAPRVHAFLKNFQLEATTQVSLAASASPQLKKQSVEGAARNWIARNQAIWGPWIPPRE